MLEVIGSIAGVVVAALIAACVKFSSDKRGRMVESQRESLYLLQGVARDYRQALIDNGDAIISTKRQNELASLDGQLETARVRCRGEKVKKRAGQWKKYAEQYWPGSEDHDAREELRLWTVLQTAVGDELRGYDA